MPSVEIIKASALHMTIAIQPAIGGGCGWYADLAGVNTTFPTAQGMRADFNPVVVLKNKAMGCFVKFLCKK